MVMYAEDPQLWLCMEACTLVEVGSRINENTGNNKRGEDLYAPQLLSNQNLFFVFEA